MASRMSRKTTTTTYTSQSSGASTSAASPGSPRRRERPPSPSRLSRMQEQEALQSLNDRLASYIDRVRHLENENSRLAVQVKSTEEIVKKEVTSVKSMYESELADARRLLDEMAKEKAKLQIDANKYKHELDDLMAKYARSQRDLANAERRVQAQEVEITDLTGKLQDAENARKHLEKENANLRADLAAAEKQLATLRKQLEEETLMRVDLENRVQSLKEDLAFKAQIYEKELDETRTRTSIRMEEVDSATEVEYEEKLREALQEMRRQHELDLRIVREEIEVLYENKLADLMGQAERGNASSQAAWEELRITKKKLDDVMGELSRLRSENATYEGRLQDLEDQLKREREMFRMELTSKTTEIAELRQSLDEQTQEYADLLDIKIKLDREIEAYRKLLEGEEIRLNLSQSYEATPKKGGKGIKRKRVALADPMEQMSTSTHTSSGYARSATSSGAIEIEEVDSDGHFIKLANNTEKDVNIGGWQLRHEAGDQETLYKFHRGVTAKAGTTVTVWSSDTETTHSPPHDLVMKGQRWFVTDEMKTSLLNTKSDEVATCTMSKSSLRSVSSYRSSLRSSEFRGSEEQPDKCSVM